MAFFLRFMADGELTHFKYFPCNEALRDWGFYVTSTGWSRIPPGHPYPPVEHPGAHNFTLQHGRVLDTFTFVYIPKGRGEFESEVSGKIEIVEGSLFIVFPNVWHRYEPDKKTGWDEYWIEFAGCAAEDFIKKSPLKPSEPLLVIENASKVMDVFMDITAVSDSQPHGFEYLLSSKAYELIALLTAETGLQKHEDREKNEAIRKARRRLIANLEKPVDLKELAMEMGMSYSLFRKAFKEITGFSPHQYRLNFRMHQASRLLVSSNLQISIIAKQLGFRSIYNFSERFKKKTGCSPLEYRKNNNISKLSKNAGGRVS